MKPKSKQNQMVGSLFFKHISKNALEKHYPQTNKSHLSEDPFLHKLLSCKDKTHSQSSILQSHPKSRQHKASPKHLSGSTICSSHFNSSSLQKSISCSEFIPIKNQTIHSNIKPKVHIRNKQFQLDSVLIKGIGIDNINENSFANNNILGKESSNITQLPRISFNMIMEKTKGSKEYAHYFKLKDCQKEHLIKTKLQYQENMFEKLRKEYCFCRNNKSSSCEKEKIEKMFDMFEREGKKVDYFHTGKSKKHIFKYRFKI